MKFIKFLITTLIIIVITCIIPIKLFSNACDMSKFYQPVDGSIFTGIYGYNNRIVMIPDLDQNIKNDSAKMLELSNEMIEYKNDTYNNLVSYLIITENILLILFGIFLIKKSNYKFVGKCFITAGIITLIIFLFIFIIIKMNIII